MALWSLFHIGTATLFFIIEPISASATECFAWVRMWPADSMPMNGRLILTGSETKQGLIRNLSAYGPRLVSASHEVPLLQGDLTESTFGMTHVVLIPNAPLQPNTTYRLEIDSLQLLTNDRPLEAPDLTVHTTDRQDMEPPQWIARPRVDDVFAGWMDVSLNFIAEVAEESGFAIRVTVESRTTGEVQHAIITAISTDEKSHVQEFWVGSHLCDIDAYLDFEERYSIRFEAVDAAGNRSLCPNTCTISFIGDDPETMGFVSDCSSEDASGRDAGETINVD